jgi:hypothetical protein
MNERPDVEALVELGEMATNAGNAWAGADSFLTRGIVAWTRQAVSEHDQVVAVRSALAACALVTPSYPADGADTKAPRRYLDDMIGQIARWCENPSHANKEAVRSSLDTGRQQHAWHGHQESAAFWTLEAVDHACLAVWSGQKSSYIVPLDYRTCTARSVTCAFRALIAGGQSPPRACDLVVNAVRSVTGDRGG